MAIQTSHLSGIQQFYIGTSLTANPWTYRIKEKFILPEG
jgi:hypothetical protein